jgi:hypothetical protein
MNCVCTLSIISGRAALAVGHRTDERAHVLVRAGLEISGCTPSFCSSSSTLPSSMMTPIEPVSVPGLATIASHALAM